MPPQTDEPLIPGEIKDFIVARLKDGQATVLCRTKLHDRPVWRIVLGPVCLFIAEDFVDSCFNAEMREAEFEPDAEYMGLVREGMGPLEVRTLGDLLVAMYIRGCVVTHYALSFEVSNQLRKLAEVKCQCGHGLTADRVADGVHTRLDELHTAAKGTYGRTWDDLRD